MDSDMFTSRVRRGGGGGGTETHAHPLPLTPTAHRAPTLPQFGVMPSRDSLTLLVAKRDDGEDRMYVFFPEADVGVPQCKTCVTA